jgi:hypothetical protein
MSKKYLDSKAGSVEEISTKIASEQPSIDRTFKADVKLTTEKKYFETKPGSLADAAAKVVSEAMDPVNKDAVKKQFKDRKDKDIDNDGDVDKTDKYLHTRRQAISKNIKEDDMAKFHKMQKDGKSADDIAKALGLDVKSVKKLMDLDEVNNPYAVGMAQAMKSTGDKPPLEKKTIKKAHDIAKGIMKKEAVKADDKGEVINKKKHDGYKDPKSGEREIINPIKEGRMKEIAIDMKDLDAEQFKTKYGKSKAEMKKDLGAPEKSFADMRKEMMNKTMTGKKVATVDTEPQSERI